MIEPTTLLGFAAVVTVQAVVTVGGIGHTMLRERKKGSMSKNVKAIEKSVNGRETSMRDDMDRLIEIGEENATGLAEMRGEVRGLTHRVDQLTIPKPTILRAAPRAGW